MSFQMNEGDPHIEIEEEIDYAPMDEDFKLRGEVSYAVSKPVVPREEFHESFLLCRLTGKMTETGFCQIHGTDACISRYVRYNHVFETMEKNFKDAMVKTRRDVNVG